MRKVILIGLTALLLSCCAVITACKEPEGTSEDTSAKGGQSTSPPATTSPSSPTTPQSTEPASFSSSWDLPLLFGLTRIDREDSWTIPPSPEAWANWEWHYFRYYTPPINLLRFYQVQEMPSRGWIEHTIVEEGLTKWGYWVKDDQSGAAMIWIMGTSGRETYLAIGRASS